MLRALRVWWHARTVRGKMERVFSRKADPYGYDTSPYEKARLAAMEAALGAGPFRNVLEVGCAEGAFTRRLSEISVRVTAVDVSATAVGRARERLKDRDNVRWVEGDVRRWKPARALAFDAIILGDVLYYLDKPLVQDEFRRIFARVASWLEPGGRLLLAHGFAGGEERRIREGYRRRFTDSGLALASETVAGDAAPGPVRCLVSFLVKPS